MTIIMSIPIYGGSKMPKISITVSDYTYWKLLGSGESISHIIQKALKDYWKENLTQKK
jgi:hypothetical protein